MGSFAIPLSGLNAAQSALQTISNNLANSNTTGFKGSSLDFSGLFAASSAVNGSGDPIQTGTGVTVAASDIDFTQGDASATGASANMDIQGAGFFVTQDANGNTAYTRAGDFSANSKGQLTTPSGELVLGYPASAGVIDTTGALAPIEVGNATSLAVPTSSFGVTANLDASATPGTIATSSLAVFDSLGGTHNLTITYTNTAPGSWDYNITVPNSDLSTGGTGSTQVGSGSVNFDSSGKLVMAGTPPATSFPVVIPPAATPMVTFANGAAPLSMQWEVDDASGNPTLTQTAATSGTSATSQNGFASGTLSTYSVLPDGTVEGVFTSGQSKPIAQVALANFANIQGLVSTGNSNYQASNASGQATIGTAGTGGRGTIVGGSIELSNVNIATEFADLIVAQQAYSANAKSVTTLQQVSQATLAMLQ
jgi:flagellar hook protein FlgE